MFSLERGEIWSNERLPPRIFRKLSLKWTILAVYSTNKANTDLRFAHKQQQSEREELIVGNKLKFPSELPINGDLPVTIKSSTVHTIIVLLFDYVFLNHKIWCIVTSKEKISLSRAKAIRIFVLHAVFLNKTVRKYHRRATELVILEILHTYSCHLKIII